MKKILSILLLLITVTLFSEEKEFTSSISMGTEYLEEFYINFGYSFIAPLEDNMELDIKASLNINTEEDSDGNITPSFNVPLKAGINFLFPIDDTFTFLAGTGISPTFRFTDDFGFLIGPNLKAGIRMKVHPSMNLFAEVCQSLLIGEPKWLYPSTEIVVGLNFSL